MTFMPSCLYLPGRLIMTTDQIDLYLIHVVGLIFDLTIGYLLFFDLTRPLAMVFCGSFHLMNSQMFSIGKYLAITFASLFYQYYLYFQIYVTYECFIFLILKKISQDDKISVHWP